MELEKYLESIGGVIDWRNHTYTTPKVFQVDEGWYPLIQNLIQELVELGWDRKITQVKEKFGGLRFYIEHGSEEVYKLIEKAESDSYKICEMCGKKGKVEEKYGWLKSLCSKHKKELGYGIS